MLRWSDFAIGGEDGVGQDDGGLIDRVEYGRSVVGVEVVVGVDGELRELGGVEKGCVGAGVKECVLYSLRGEGLECGEVGGVSVGEE